MASTAYVGVYSSILCKSRASSLMGISSFSLMEPIMKPETTYSHRHHGLRISPCPRNVSYNSNLKKLPLIITRASSKPSGSSDEALGQDKTPFGYTRKDVLLIGLGLTLLGFGLESGLEFLGVDPLQAGNVVQLVLVLGLTVAWISTYIFRVSNKEMTYAQQLRDYEGKVMEKRLESLTEAELQLLLEQVEEEKSRLASGEEVK